MVCFVTDTSDVVTEQLHFAARRVCFTSKTLYWAREVVSWIPKTVCLVTQQVCFGANRVCFVPNQVCFRGKQILSNQNISVPRANPSLLCDFAGLFDHEDGVCSGKTYLLCAEASLFYRQANLLGEQRTLLWRGNNVLRDAAGLSGFRSHLLRPERNSFRDESHLSGNKPGFLRSAVGIRIAPYPRTDPSHGFGSPHSSSSGVDRIRHGTTAARRGRRVPVVPVQSRAMSLSFWRLNSVSMARLDCACIRCLIRGNTSIKKLLVKS